MSENMNFTKYGTFYKFNITITLFSYYEKYFFRIKAITTLIVLNNTNLVKNYIAENL